MLFEGAGGLLFHIQELESEMWNIQISDQVTATVIRQTIKRGHGNM